MKAFKKVSRKDLVIGNTYFDIPVAREEGSESFVYVGTFKHDKYGNRQFMYPLSESNYPQIEKDGTVAFALIG